MGGFVSLTCIFRQAISTGLVNRCAMCKGRPRRTGERVCSRTCRERERQGPQVRGSYYGVPVVRREPRTRPGEFSQQSQPSGPSGHRELNAEWYIPSHESRPDSGFPQGDPTRSPAPYFYSVEGTTQVSPTVGPDKHEPDRQDPYGYAPCNSDSRSQSCPGGSHSVTHTSHFPGPPKSRLSVDPPI
jgi:hypothetical protein